ncbi:PEP-CTERM sorting domain-containing protein [Microcoleus sp. B5-D4]|uniref:exosortase-dependent surface protein XDP2 n=1 Tax=unclassified Microcoleus TaxID=2642155 RepID=UPI002FCEEAAD
MNTKLFPTLATLAATLGMIAVQSPAKAFNFTTNLTTSGVPDAKSDIWLKSVTYGGKTTSDFAFVNAVKIINNTPIKSGLDPKKQTSNPEDKTKNNDNSGAASTDKGDKASSPIVNGQAVDVSGIKNPTGGEMAAYLGNNNLNNIIDTEDAGSFKLNLSFTKAVGNLFFWERGMNSTIRVQALDAMGNTIGKLLNLNSGSWGQAGYSINTQEIDTTHKVGAWGVSLADLGVSGPIGAIQVSTLGSPDNGPDFKVIGETEATPEPLTMLAAGAAVSFGAMFKKQRAQAQKAE